MVCRLPRRRPPEPRRCQSSCRLEAAGRSCRRSGVRERRGLLSMQTYPESFKKLAGLKAGSSGSPSVTKACTRRHCGKGVRRRSMRCSRAAIEAGRAPADREAGAQAREEGEGARGGESVVTRQNKCTLLADADDDTSSESDDQSSRPWRRRSPTVRRSKGRPKDSVSRPGP